MIFGGRRPAVLPVIHVESSAQAIRNATLAHEHGADGVFLINHGPSDAELLAIHRAVAAALPDWWIGVNCMGLAPRELVGRIPLETSGIWVDNALVEEGAAEQAAAQAVLDARRERDWRGLHFAGVAFKHQKPVADLEAATAIAARYCDVVTTSGAGTGQAAPVDKIRRMKRVLGEAPLAIASGITPENVREYVPHVDCLLVATGIARSFHEIDPAKLDALLAALG